MMRRRAVRAILMSEADQRILLMRAKAPDAGHDLWLTPGGGVEAGEGDADALRREIFEETGLRLEPPPPLVWTRTHVYRMDGIAVEQHERIYFSQVAAFEPTVAFNPSAEEMSVFREFRWWSIDEIRGSGDVFVPRRMADELQRLIDLGVPRMPVDVGT